MLIPEVEGHVGESERSRGLILCRLPKVQQQEDKAFVLVM
jgi:hypothetical protein